MCVSVWKCVMCVCVCNTYMCVRTRLCTRESTSLQTPVRRLCTRSAREGTLVVHPADLDDALCTSAAMASSGSKKTQLPFAVDDALLQDAPSELWGARLSNAARPFSTPDAFDDA